MDKVYQPQKVEKKIYDLWETGGYFTPKIDLDKKPFSIIMPPPNANDPLHIGHAMFVAIEDILIRYHRMRGEPTLWLPGSDHAGIETQYVFEKKLQKEGKSRFDFKREEFYKAVYDYVTKNTKVMTKQLRQLGASCDWTRFKFTLDPAIVKIVYQTFYKLYQDGLVYRGERMINFCHRCGTAFSDLEAKDVVQKDPLYFIKYGPLTVATVRPETKFGDTALAVNPEDQRYKRWIDHLVEVEDLLGKFKIRVIADKTVDPKFGTGVVKVTPAHDVNDYEIGLRHNLEIRRVIDFNGRLNEKTGRYQGLKIKQAREIVVKDLKDKGLILKTDQNYEHAIKVCYRCSTTLEPMLLPQWFIKVENLKKPAINAVKKGEIKILPKRFVKQYLYWMENLKDWNISRQIWWGIPIPAWYCTDCAKIEKIGSITYIPKEAPLVISETKPAKCPKCNGKKLIKDPDTFDTWFSSGQWPFATLMTTKKGDFEYFYPTSVMETGADILYLWVARMIMLGIYQTGKIPFKTVYLHAIVRDKQGQKISKSKGNIIDPIEVCQKYGADSLRTALIWGVSAGGDSYIDESKIIGQRNFTNKLWNISRFVLMHQFKLKFKNEKVKITIKNLKLKEDKELLKKLENLIKTTTLNLDQFKISQALEDLYQFTWHEFADKYLEGFKKRTDNQQSLHTLHFTLYTLLKLLHPFMPFITEEIWQKLYQEKPLIVSSWPKV